MSDTIDILTLIFCVAVTFFLSVELGQREGYKEGYDQAIHDCQQNTFESDTTITYKSTNYGN